MNSPKRWSRWSASKERLRSSLIFRLKVYSLKKPQPRRHEQCQPAGVSDDEIPPRDAVEQRTLFDLDALAPEVSERRDRVTALDRRFVIAALRDIYHRSTEPHIRRIADDVLFAHRIPTEEESVS
jgi:hypothetical protein